MAVPEMPQQARDVHLLLLFIPRHHTHQLPHLLLEVIPVQNQGHRLRKEFCELAANRLGTITDDHDWEWRLSSTIVLLQLPPYACGCRHNRLTRRRNASGPILNPPRGPLDEPDMGAHPRAPPLLFGFARLPLPPRLLQFDLDRIRQD